MEQRNMHFSAKPISRSNNNGKPKSAVSMAAYRAGDKLRDDRYQTTWDYTRKQSIYHTEIIAPDGAPDWAKNREQLWNKVEAAEKRFDARVCREFTISLPAEIRHEHKIEIMRSFVRENFTAKGIVADLACHNFIGREAHNPHCHIMITTRPLAGERFSKHKDRSLDQKDALKQWRKSYMDIANKVLEREGYTIRITTESLETRGITDRAPISESMAVSQMRKKHEQNPQKYSKPEVAKQNDELHRLNQELATLKQELAQAEKEEPRPREVEQNDQQPIKETTKNVGRFAAEQATPAANQNEPPPPVEELDEDTRELLRQWQEYRDRERRKPRRPEDRDERGFDDEHER
ncbi:MobQ family relaxase [Tolypothrix sp. VBCCA 56010]|uniref:MobQ family relaxase n=1 Tax=Tolypothrix sp. VBCCA 56010 TaxID=3137731 RepID=UPI003D7C4A04